MNLIKLLIVYIPTRIQKKIFRALLVFVPSTSLPLKGPVGIAMLLCHVHIPMAIFSLHSFFFEMQKILPCTVIDDGSMTKKDIDVLKRHFRGINIIKAKQAKRMTMILLRKFPYAAKHRNELAIKNKFNIKLFDPILLPPYNKIILLDSDIIFLKRPDRILKWAKTDNNVSLYARHFYTKNYTRIDADTTWLITLRMFIERINKNIDFRFNSGLLCISKQVFSLPRIERLMKYLYAVGLGITWAPEQYILSTIVAESASEPLNSSYIHTHSAKEYHSRIKNPSEYTCIHFAYMAKYLFFPLAITMLIRHNFYRKIKPLNEALIKY